MSGGPGYGAAPQFPSYGGYGYSGGSSTPWNNGWQQPNQGYGGYGSSPWGWSPWSGYQNPMNMNNGQGALMLGGGSTPNTGQVYNPLNGAPTNPLAASQLAQNNGMSLRNM